MVGELQRLPFNRVALPTGGSLAALYLLSTLPHNMMIDYNVLIMGYPALQAQSNDVLTPKEVNDALSKIYFYR